MKQLSSKGNYVPLWYRQMCKVLPVVLLGSMAAPAFADVAAHNVSNGVAIVQQQGKVAGHVVDAQGNPMSGVAVVVVGTKTMTMSDNNGVFKIAVKQGQKLRFSLLGYTPQTIVYQGGSLNVKMNEQINKLDEVVVVGYGKQKKVNVTGAVSMIDSKALDSRPVQNLGQALQGQIPGLTFSVNNGGGSLDNKLNFSIRGGGTIGTGSVGSPLVLIDGIEGDMNTVNPNDIQSVSVLKDAASASIYGARGAFGVILITTKSGKSGKTKVNYTGNLRFSTAIQLPEMVSSLEFAKYFNTASSNGGAGNIFSDEVMDNMNKYYNHEFTDPSKPEYWGTTVNPQGRYNAYTGSFANTNWFDEFYDKNAPAQEHNLSVSGGTEKLTYLLSGSFLKQKGLLRRGEDLYNRYTLNAKISSQLNSWAHLNYNGKWTRDDYERPTYMTGLFFHNIARRWPTCPAVDPHGHPFPQMEIIEMESGGKQKHQHDWFTNQLQLVLEPIKDWHITAEGSMRRYMNRYTWAVLPIFGYDANDKPYALNWSDKAPGYSEAKEGMGMQDYFSTNFFTDYSKTIAGHYFKVLGGMNTELYKNRGLQGFGTDLITPTVPELATTQDNQKTSNSASELAIAGFFGRLNYNFKEKYIFEANLRYDGSSRFVKEKRWKLFPSFSAGWNVAKENFFAPLRDYIGTLKFRGSWGQLGNNTVNSYYPFYQGMNTGVNNSGWLIGNQQVNTSSMPGIVSSLLTWENIESWDFGFDWAAFNNRFTGSVSVYNRKTKDMVAKAAPLPGILGANTPNLNNADMKSYGWELEMQWRDRINDFKYGVRFVLDDNQRKITRYYNETGSLSDFYAGKKLGEIWGFETVGIAQTQEQMDEHLKENRPSFGANWAAGDIMYKNIADTYARDENGDIKLDASGNPIVLDANTVNYGNYTLDSHGDLRVIGNSTPRYKFGLTLDAEWKGIDVQMFFQGVMKRDYWVNGAYFWGAEGGMWQSACFKEHLDYWTPDNPKAYYPRPLFNGAGKNHQVQTGYLQDASYIRLKNFQIGYTLPKSWTDKMYMQSLRVYFSADNVVTFTKMSKIFDPETLGGAWGAGKLYPLQRTLSFGVNVNF